VKLGCEPIELPLRAAQARMRGRGRSLDGSALLGECRRVLERPEKRMRQMLRGPVPWAVVLCRFTDIDIPLVPKSMFFDIVSEYGRNGLHDYWKDVSLGNISTAGSEVFGWYTMRYSFAHDSLDPLHNPADKETHRRIAWTAEARRLATENGIDLSAFYAVIAVINGPGDSSSDGLDLVMNVTGPWGQDQWRWCRKCQGLAYAGHPATGRCPAGGAHAYAGS